MAAEQARKLHRDGYLVLPSAYVSPGKTLETSSLRDDWERAFAASPEFKHHPTFAELADPSNLYVCGASAFAGNPSVTHCEVSRTHRVQTTAALMPILAEFVKLLGRDDLQLAHIPDRVQVRGPNRSTSKDSWHRDFPAQIVSAAKTKKRKAEDCFSNEVWLGGWENCDSTPQAFCALKGTHLLDASGGGFSKIAASQHPELNAQLLAQANQPDTDSTGKIVIPPRHFVLSFANMVHAVNPASFKYTSVKAFLGAYRLTSRSDSGLVHPDKTRLITHEEQEARMVANDVQIMSSGQYPPAYPANYLVCRDKQLPIFEAFQEKMLIPGAMKFDLRNEAGELQHKAHQDWTRSFASLKDMGVPLHPPYKPHEFALMRPSREVTLPNAAGEMVTYSLY